MTTERNVALLFASNAVINWVVSLPGIVDPEAAAAAFGGEARNYPSIVIWIPFIVWADLAVRRLVAPRLTHPGLTRAPGRGSLTMRLLGALLLLALGPARGLGGVLLLTGTSGLAPHVWPLQAGTDDATVVLLGGMAIAAFLLRDSHGTVPIGCAGEDVRWRQNAL